MTRRNTNSLVLTAVTLAALCALLLTAAQSASPQTAPVASHSVWDGVYAEKQAQRGQVLYGQQCSSCHGEKLAGKESEDVPALTGRDFESEWKGRTVGDLFRKILRKMPQDNPGQLTPQQSADLAAFILSFNAFPAGKTELPAQNEALVGIRFDDKKPEQK